MLPQNDKIGAENDNLKDSAESSLDFATRTQIAESATFCHSERKRRISIFEIFRLAQYDNFLDSSVAMLPQNDKIGAENDNLKDSAESSLDFATRTQIAESATFCHSERKRRISIFEIFRFAQYDNLREIAESALDSAILKVN